MGATNKQKYLIVKGCAGLGNRLCTIASALEYCMVTNRVIIVDWSDNLYSNQGVNVFNKYFKIKAFPHLNNIEDIPEIDQLTFYPKIWGQHFHKSVSELYVNDTCGMLKRVPYKYIGKGRLNILKQYWRYKTKPNDKASQSTIQALLALLDNRNITMGGRYKNNIIEDAIFYADYIPDFNKKFLINHVFFSEIILEQSKNFIRAASNGARVIGVHIRYTDNKPSQDLKQLFNVIKMLNNQPNTKIFVATDNIEIQTQLIINFKNVITFQKILPTIESGGLHHWAQNNGQAKLAIKVLEESLIELSILANCEMLLYQSNSSFSRIAEIYHCGVKFDWTSNNDIRKLSQIYPIVI